MSEPHSAWIIDSFFHWYWAQPKSHLTKDNIKKVFVLVDFESIQTFVKHSGKEQYCMSI